MLCSPGGSRHKFSGADPSLDVVPTDTISQRPSQLASRPVLAAFSPSTYHLTVHLVEVT